ncbi:MAG: NUDIX hydrolase [Parachlamydiaceae bacterium]
MQRQLTASAYIIGEQQVLLIHHRKLQKWLPPGGHVEANEIPSEAVKREVLEETGLQIQIISDEYVEIDRWNAKSLPRPYLCLLEEIPAFGEQEAHQHIDFIYLARPIGGVETLNTHETNGLRWFTLAEIEALAGDVEIFTETQLAIRSIFDMLSKNEDLCAKRPFLSLPQDKMSEKQLCV